VLGTPAAGTDPRNAPFFEALNKLGWIEGKNVAVERRFADEHADRLSELAAELVRLKVDVIVAGDSAAIPAAKSATSTIPIVMTVSSDPVGQGFVASLARPGGNVTGLSNISPELAAKRLQLLKDIVPAMSRVAVFGPPGLPDWAELAAVTRAVGVKLVPLEVTDPREFENALDTAMQKRADALIVLPSPFTNPYARRIVQLAAERHLPAIYALGIYVRVGGLIAYGPNIPDLYRRAATYVDKILKGLSRPTYPLSSRRSLSW
jgi:putative tryptophan/tyrosine transport system substrate-binding protein